MTSTIEPTPPKIDFNFYEQPSTISYFDGIVSDLQQELDLIGANSSITAPELAYFTARFLHFQQNQFATTRIPIKLFSVQDLSKTSPLYTILKAAWIFQSDKDLDDWQFDGGDDATDKEAYLELIRYVKRALEQDGFDTPSRILFDEHVESGKKEDLTRLIQSLGGKNPFTKRERKKRT